MSKIVTVKTVATATVHETWTFRVPDDWTAHRDDVDEQVQVLADMVGWLLNQVDQDGQHVALLDVTNDKVTDERDRETVDFHIVPERPAVKA